LAYLDTFKSRVNAFGINEEGKVTSLGKTDFENYLNNSPNAFDVLINGLNEVRISIQDHSDTDKKDDFKILLSRTEDNINAGDFFNWRNNNWLIITKQYKTIETCDKFIISICNNTISFPSTITKTKVGTDSLGRPIYESVEGTLDTFNCVASTKQYSFDDNRNVNLPYNNLSVTMSYSTNENIKEGKTFNMYGLDYKIIGIDYSKVLNNVGIIQLLADRVI